MTERALYRLFMWLGVSLVMGAEGKLAAMAAKSPVDKLHLRVYNLAPGISPGLAASEGRGTLTISVVAG